MTVVPQADLSTGDGRHPVRPLTPVLRWIKPIFLLSIAADIGLAVASILYALMDPTPYTPVSEIYLADWISIIAGAVFILALIAGAISFGIWSVRAMRNLHALGAPSAEMKPGWTIGWYFVPIANLFMPYRAMDQIEDGTYEVTSVAYPDQGVSRVGVWWGCWILTNILGNISFRMTDSVGFVGTFGPVQVVEIASSVTGVAAAALLLSIVTRITDAQDNHALGHTFS